VSTRSVSGIDVDSARAYSTTYRAGLLPCSGGNDARRTRWEPTKTRISLDGTTRTLAELRRLAG
jgi:hypothetical protein